MRFLRILFGIGLLVLGVTASPAHASKIQKAIDAYLKGQTQAKAGQYAKALRSFETAHQNVPRLPHFNCRRSTFLQYQGSMLVKLGRPYQAMRRYYDAAYSSGCKEGKTTGPAASWYKSLDRRYMSYLTINTTPPKANVIAVTTKGEDKIAQTPYSKRMMPGRYRFKIRLYDHKTVVLDIQLKPGSRINKEIALAKGEDPVSRTENVDVAPPPPIGDQPEGGDPAAQGTGGDGNTGSTETDEPKQPKITFKEDPANPTETRVAGTGIGSGTGKDDDLGVTKRTVVKPGPPIYKQAWFWITIGVVVTGAVVVAIVVPKEQTVNVGQGTLF